MRLRSGSVLDHSMAQGLLGHFALPQELGRLAESGGEAGAVGLVGIALEGAGLLPATIDLLRRRNITYVGTDGLSVGAN